MENILEQRLGCLTNTRSRTGGMRTQHGGGMRTRHEWWDAAAARWAQHAVDLRRGADRGGMMMRDAGCGMRWDDDARWAQHAVDLRRGADRGGMMMHDGPNTP